MIDVPEKVKELFKMDGIRKNIRIHFPNGERTDITNSQIIEESFRFTESVCSQNEFKFGLCEAAVVEFEVYGIENVKGYEIEVFHEIDISSLNTDFITTFGLTSDDVTFPFYRLPYGIFIVDECQRQSDMKRRKVVAYTKIHYVNWNFNKITNDIIDNHIWINKKPLRFSMESIEKLLIPESTYLEEIEPIRKESYVNNIHLNSRYNTYYLDFYYERYEFTTLWKNHVNIIRKEYSQECASKIDTLINSMNTLEIKTPQISEIQFVSNNLTYRYFKHYSDITEEVYSYALKDEEKTINIGNLFEHKNMLISFPVLYDTYEALYTTENSANWNVSPVGIGASYVIMPYRFVLKKATGPQSWEVIYDSGLISGNKVFFNGDTLIGESASGCFVTIATPYKKNVKMIKYYANDNEPETLSQSVYRYTRVNIEDLRDVFESWLELNGVFGQYSRDGKFVHKKIENYFGVYPSENLFPAETLYPNEANAGSIFRNNYMSAWYDEKQTKPYDRVTVTYKNSDDEDVFTFHEIISEDSDDYNAEDYQTYSLGRNTLIQNEVYTEEQIETILSTVANSVKNIQYMPADIELQGLPWIEAGDVVIVITEDSAIETFVLRRTLTGIDTLVDNYESKG